jgi:hypothetical protein
MVLGVIVFAVSSSPSGPANRAPPPQNASLPLFADFYTSEALRHAPHLTRQVVSVVGDAYSWRRALQAPPTLSLGGDAYTHPGGGVGLNPLARFLRVASAAPQPDVPTTPSSEKGVVRLVVGEENINAFGREDEGDGGHDRGDDGDVLLLWQVERDIAFCLIVEEATDNLALAEMCISTVKLCLREILRPLGAVPATAPPKPVSASVAPPISHSPSPVSSSSRKTASSPTNTESSDSGGGDGGGGGGDPAMRGDALTAREVLSNPALLMAVVHHIMPGGKLMFVGVDAARTISANVRQRVHVVAGR